MNITLVTASFNDEVHGTFNDKKTGCGINLLKPENVTRYRRGGKMTDLGEVTCEKCKTRIAKEMIKSDQKEMRAILKEEKLRAKKGIEDENIIPLGNTTAKITSAQNVPEPEPAPAPMPQKPAYQPNGAPALDSDLAQFAIKKPDEEPKTPSTNQFVAERPNLFDDEPTEIAKEVTAPESAPALEDDFLAQFAIQKPADPEEEPKAAEEDDFLAQFAVTAPHKEEPKPEEPAAPPVIDDISAALAAMQQTPIGTVPKAPEPEFIPEPEPESAPLPSDEDDIMKMFSIGSSENSDMEVLSDTEPVETSRYDNDSTVIDVEEQNISPVQPAAPAVEPIEEEHPSQDFSSEWDLLANRLFGGEPEIETAEAPVIEDIVPVDTTKTPVIEDIVPIEVPEAPIIKDIAPIEEPKVPVIEDIVPIEAPKAPVIEDIAPIEASQAPVIEDIAPIETPEAPVIEDIAPIEAPKAPVIEDIAPIETPETPVIEDIAPIEAPKVPVIEDIVPIEAPKVPVIEDIVPIEVPKAPVIEDIAPIETHEAPVIEEAAVPTEEERPILEDISNDDDDLEYIAESLEPKAPVLDDISSALSALNTSVRPAGAVPSQPVTTPVSPVPVQPMPSVPVQPIPDVPVQPVAPAPIPAQPAAPTTAPAGAVGQVISVPQLTGYDHLNQPVYTYVQMQIQGYDLSGQPILVPLPGQNIPLPTMPSSYNKNTRLQDAIAAAKEVPTSSREMTPGQRIAAAEAAKGSPISANVSKIATNPHTRSTSQAFISAISESKEYANQCLTETQGLKQRTGVLNSVEDVLSQLGDNSLKEKKLAEAKIQSNIPAFQEYKSPAARTSYAPRSSSSAPRPAAPVDDRPLTKTELKARKKQEKIDAKFQKEMAKRK